MPYKSVQEAIQKHPNLKKYSPKAQRSWFKSFDRCWFASHGRDEGMCFRIAYAAANRTDGVSSIRELNPEEEMLEQVIRTLRATRNIGELGREEEKAIPNEIWEKLAFHAANRVIDRAMSAGIPIPEKVLEIYEIRKSYQGFSLTQEQASYLYRNSERVNKIEDELGRVYMEELQATSPGEGLRLSRFRARLRPSPQKLESYHIFYTVGCIWTALYVDFDSSNAYGWSMDQSHAANLAFYESYNAGYSEREAMGHFNDAAQKEGEYLAWWLADVIAVYIAKQPIQRWAEESEEILYNPQREFNPDEDELREENVFCPDPGFETEKVIVDDATGYVYKIRDVASEFTPGIWKIKAFISKKVPYIVDMEYDTECDVIKQRYIEGIPATLDEVEKLKDELEEYDFDYVTDLVPSNVIKDEDGYLHIVDFRVDFGHPEFWSLTRRYRRLAQFEKEAMEELEAMYRRKEEELGYRENPDGYDGDGNDFYGRRGLVRRPPLRRWTEPYHKIEVLAEIGGTDSDEELYAAARELARCIGTRVQVLPPETAAHEPYLSMLPLVRLPDVDTADKLATLYFNIEVGRSYHPDVFYLFDGRVYAQVFEALFYPALGSTPEFYSFEVWPLLLKAIEERTRQRRDMYYREPRKL